MIIGNNKVFFNIDQVAYEVIPTLGGRGILVNNKEPLEISMLKNRMIKDKTLSLDVISGQRRRLQGFDGEAPVQSLLDVIEHQMGDSR